MREILFRGKTPGGWWVYGDHIKDRIQTDGKPNEYIMIRFFNVFEGENFEDYEFIIPETIGQYTGLKDKNGKEIYEGDIVQEWLAEEHPGNLTYHVGFERGHFTLTEIESGYDKMGIWNVNTNLDIIGNIYENPELLK